MGFNSAFKGLKTLFFQYIQFVQNEIIIMVADKFFQSAVLYIQASSTILNPSGSCACTGAV